MAKLSGKVAVITGASKGIGAEIAKTFAAEGAAVVVNYASSQKGADKVVGSITQAGGKAIAVQGDVTKASEAEGIIEAAVKNFGRLDILVNNAGIYNDNSSIEAITEATYRKFFDINVLGLLLTTQAAVRHLGEGASIINLSTLATSVFLPNYAIYTASKCAVDGITGALAAELGPRKIRVNGINPGSIATEGTHSAGITGSDFHKMLIARTPLGRGGQPDDIAKIALFLASDDSGWVTGERIAAAGGMR